ncbi:GpE family phage tail protein [Atlantibacter hermannii]|uniref:GpE family phage tail protein n=1 Tax=Atlantibacter hermannii TaxID=565 RepID=UPI00406D35A2
MRGAGQFFVTEVGNCRFPDKLTVDDLIADIATIFHWPPDVTGDMSLTELLEWRHKAILRSGAADE